MKVAIVHDLLCGYSGYAGYAGSERVVEQLLILYPDADLFSIVDFLPEAQRGFINHKPVQTSFIQGNPLARLRNSRLIPYFLPLMPYAIEDFDVSQYDLVMSSSHSVAKGVITGPDQLHISYVHSPLRYAWDFQHLYLTQVGAERGIKSWLFRWILHHMRIWDLRTANGVDCLVANSYFISRRIRKVYQRDSIVVYPPVDVEAFTMQEVKEDYYLVVARMVPYKRVDLIVEAFTRTPERKLIVVGEGTDQKKIRSRAGPNITILAHQEPQSLVGLMQKARAFIIAAKEDFGITPLEAQACGTPVIAFAGGATLETIHGLDTPRPTGVFFPEQSVSSLLEAIAHFEKVHTTIHSQECRSNALRFAPQRFRDEMRRVIDVAQQTFDIRQIQYKSHPVH